MDLIEMREALEKQVKSADECKLQAFIQSIPEEDRNKPISFSCNCKRCLPSM